MRLVLLGLLVAGCATRPVLTAHARGAQIYVCTAHEWVLRAPDAELTGERGEPIGRHYAGPTWETKDGSKLVAEVKEKKAAPAPGAVPWLKLAVKKSEGGGILKEVHWIERVDTQGGVAPAGGCEDGQETRVDYTATYKFYR